MPFLATSKPISNPTSPRSGRSTYVLYMKLSNRHRLNDRSQTGLTGLICRRLGRSLIPSWPDSDRETRMRCMTQASPQTARLLLSHPSPSV